MSPSTSRALRTLPPAILFVLLGTWTADAIKGVPPFFDWFSATPAPLAMKALIAVALFISMCAAAFWLYTTRSAWGEPPRVLKQTTGGVPRKVLVVTLSTPPEQVKGFDLGGGKSIVLYENAADNLMPIPTPAAAKADMKRHNWQQALRAVDHHAKDLELLIMVPSSGAGGSAQKTKQFIQWMEHYQNSTDWARPAGTKPFLIREVEAVDFEDFKGLQHAYTQAIELAKAEHYVESDVVIDVTGGQKTTSIAGAMVTLTSDADFQYIQTVPPYGLITYSLVNESHSVG
ncbi:hypothetical protein [Rhodoferax sp.]|uniref:hypothetical protein n=1 Tax=Rhodoferax sp. TaxID=50421 RepID=UPI00261AF0C6|nr:hypothetical protein [Rhodoferax sp.]MDD2919539.1 hypothetical protein [Rhodoferax sp.]